jgi:Xaa-Pro aminopeptidase
MTIVREFSKMLSSIPHDQAFTQLLIDQIVTYYDKCCGWYKGWSVYIYIFDCH